MAISGSVARGESNLDSDIDILFDYDLPSGLEVVMIEYWYFRYSTVQCNRPVGK
ncbi:MAG: hypothetical protein HC835_06525 [Oscillatoriales cyanobacterium RM2_1_1]|nr:hypothetical protein [Oscillatoriales cyanobacterium SM2_3_0]NJO45303.1 hypothetical protein [Oscillatoriales cyanobacterium RM2_1_1]